MLCPKCGTLAGESRICPACGAKLPRKRSPRRRPRGAAPFWQELLLAAAALGLLFAIVLGALSATGNLELLTSVIRDSQQIDENTLSISGSYGAYRHEAALPESSVAENASPPDESAASLPDVEAPPVSLEELPVEPDDFALDFALPEMTEDEIELAVSEILEKYNQIMRAVSTGAVRSLSPSTGVTYYYLNSSLVAVTMQKSLSDAGYARAYYYDDNSLIFSSFDGETDAYRLYVHDGALLRLSHIPDRSDRTNVINYDLDSHAEYAQWKTLIVTEARYHYLASLTAPAPSSSQNADYVLPDSARRFLSADELLGFSAEECHLARNEIYARHGRRFVDPALQRYFDAKDWYVGTVEPEDFSEEVFNEYEWANCQLILAYEKEKGYR